MTIVPSYIQDTWWSPSKEVASEPVTNPANGRVVAQISTSGLDTVTAVHHARSVGQESLGRYTIHERALLLKEMAILLNAEKQSLYDLAVQTGATPNDSIYDVDGGVGVLFTLSSKARRELPNAQIILDGAPEILSKDGSFLGRHIYSRLPGVAVQINAFNFPVWGTLEKFAPAFLAGVPTIIKPASSTAFVTQAMVKILTDSDLLPAGALQLVSGPIGSMLDHLSLGDTVLFTGSQETALKIRQHEAFTRHGVRFNAETDSLNAIVMGSDVTVDSPEFSAFVRAVTTEMTVKAGQKCTSIRRIFVPEGMKKHAIEAISKRLEDKAVVGDPSEQETTVGPLVTTAQKRDVLAKTKLLLDAGGRLVHGSLDDQTVDETGFVSPMLLDFDDAYRSELHEVEAFGPISSIAEYESTSQVIELVALGAGSLVATIVSDDPALVRDITLAIAPLHGRVHVLNGEVSRSSTGHGSPVPHLVHGGPGRAGGGEELGGVRAVYHFMQRTALQGSPRMLTEITGVWHPRATTDTSVHPFQLGLDQLRPGAQIKSVSRTVTLDDIEYFAHTTGDLFYAHMDEEAAAANPFFPGRVAHGYLLISWAAGLFVWPDPGPVLANFGLDHLRFITPVSPGDSIRVELTAKEIKPRQGETYGEVKWDAVILNQNDEAVATYDLLTLVSNES